MVFKRQLQWIIKGFGKIREEKSEMEKPKIVAIKQKKLSLERKPSAPATLAPPTWPPVAPTPLDRPNFLSTPPVLTELERSLADEIRKRGENLPEDFEEKLRQDERRETAMKLAAEENAQARGKEKELAEKREAERELLEKQQAQKQVEQTSTVEKTGVAQTANETESAQTFQETKVEEGETPQKQESELAKQPEVKPAGLEKPKPKIIARKEYAPITVRPPGGSMQKVREDIVNEMRQQASRDIIQVRKEIGKPVVSRQVQKEEVETDETVRQIGQEADPAAKKQRVVEQAIKKFEQNEVDRSLVKRLMRSLGLK